MSNTISGVVESMSRDRKSVKVDGNWYSNKFKELPEDVQWKGDVVLTVKPGTTFWQTAKGGGDMSNGTQTGTGSHSEQKMGEVYLSRDRAIIRQNALTNAVNFCTSLVDNKEVDWLPEEVIQVAMKFEKYTSGDLDKEILNDME